MSVKKYWIWLSLACGASSRLPALLLAEFSNDIEAIYNAEKDRLEQIPELKDSSLARLCKKGLTEAEEIEGWCSESGVTLLTPDDNRYPGQFRLLPDYPPVLYCAGTIPDFSDNLFISAVGTRTMSEYGRREAYKICYDLARCGAVVVSGMARGIDSVSHTAALDAGGFTVSIIGSGIDIVYPPENRELARRIANDGLVMTEFAPGTPPLGRNFPIRNRLIASFSQATVVFEAGFRSGALITAKKALLYGKQIYALPGKVGEENSVGTISLIKEGAQLIEKAVDILDGYTDLYPHRIHTENISKKSRGGFDTPYDELRTAQKVSRGDGFYKKYDERRREKSEPPAKKPADLSGIELDENERAVLYSLPSDGGITSDEIAKRTGLEIQNILTALTMLEIKGIVSALPGGVYLRK